MPNFTKELGSYTPVNASNKIVRHFQEQETDPYARTPLPLLPGTTLFSPLSSQFFHEPPKWLEPLVSAVAFSKSAPPSPSLYRMYKAIKEATRQIPVPEAQKGAKKCKHGFSTAQSEMIECAVCGNASCCKVHKVCTKCNEGFECTCGLHARFCVAITHVVRERRLKPVHRRSILRVRKEIFLALSKKHKDIHEAHVGVPLAEHARSLAHETKDERAMVDANAVLYKSNYSLAGMRGPAPSGVTTQLEDAAKDACEASARVAANIGVQRGKAFVGWWEEAGVRAVGREMPEVNGKLTKTR